ncbi:unnamed protein product [Lepeophtheirus salmonis]|uniref:(salmon louse) hypothetical protein n=1 Tax=Lepeophtheirus salmonis TaxID=72036 RepID=A0A7R8CSG1_LEPSM|nr:unnamed protein product [Lepeophtheirus salmonis]CAF2877049.1 unnamed protein product [Lepeophtheirus salmonis]
MQTSHSPKSAFKTLLRYMKMISTLCGLGSWRPQVLQRFATRRMYIFIYCIIGVIHGMLFSYFSTILSTIEKKFGLKSQEIAWVYSGNEISQAFFLFALPFMGIIRKRTLFMGSLNYSIRSRSHNLWDTPFFRSGAFISLSETQELFMSGRIISIYLLNGFSRRHLIEYFGIPYIDDNSDKAKSPISLSFVFCCKNGWSIFRISFCVTIFKIERIPRKKNYEMLGFDEKDERWIGAWNSLVLTEEKSNNKESEFAVETPETASEWWEHTKSLVSRLLTNKIYIFNLCSSIAFLFGFLILIWDFPVVLLIFISSTIGIMTSGWVISRYKLKARSLAMWCVFSDVVGIFFFTAVVFIGCKSINFLPPCETDCYCTDSAFLPICSLNGAQQFVSPCYAGCTSSFLHDEGKTIYENCSCIDTLEFTDISNMSISKNIGGDGINGYCEDESCGSQFLIFISLMGIFCLRAIHPKDKASALTLSVSLLSLFAFLPATVVFGYIIDKTCAVWKTQECTNEEASCLVYDNSSMRLYSGIFMCVFILIQSVFDLLVWYYSKDLIVFDNQEEEELAEKKTTRCSK